MYPPSEASIIKESTYGYHLIPIQDEMLSHREVELVGEVTAETVNALVLQDINLSAGVEVGDGGGTGGRLGTEAEGVCVDDAGIDLGGKSGNGQERGREDRQYKGLTH